MTLLFSLYIALSELTKLVTKMRKNKISKLCVAYSLIY